MACNPLFVTGSGLNSRFRLPTDALKSLTFGIVHPNSHECLWLMIDGVQQQPRVGIYRGIARVDAEVCLEFVVSNTPNVQQGEPSGPGGTELPQDHLLLLGQGPAIDESEWAELVSDEKLSFDVGFRIGAKITDHGISIESQIIDATNFVHAVEGVPPMRELYELEELRHVVARTSSDVGTLPDDMIGKMLKHMGIKKQNYMQENLEGGDYMPALRHLRAG